MRTPSGFSLAELLLALLILGQIAVFSIPKVLSAQQDSQKKAVLKEVISTLSELTYLGTLQSELTDTTCTNYFKAHLNSVKFCSTDAIAQNCWGHTADPNLASLLDEPGFILHNGATIGGFDGGNPTHDHIAIDWNGATGPNIEGEDQLAVRIVWANGDGFGDKAGSVVARSTSPASVTLFQQLFQ